MTVWQLLTFLFFELFIIGSLIVIHDENSKISILKWVSFLWLMLHAVTVVIYIIGSYIYKSGILSYIKIILATAAIVFAAVTIVGWILDWRSKEND